jgi:hypothetical protein
MSYLAIFIQGSTESPMQKQEIKSFQSGKEDIKLLAFTESI